MELRRYINILWRRKWVIIFTILVTMIIVVLGTGMQTPKYRASAVLRIAASSNGAMTYSDYVRATQMTNTYVEIATSRPILDKLKEQLGLEYLPPLTVEVIPNTELIQISVEGAYPDRVAEVSNSLAEILVAESSELYLGGGDKSSQDILGEQIAKSQIDLNHTRDAYEKLIIQTPAIPEKIETTRQLLQLKQGAHERLLEDYREMALREEVRSSLITVIEPALAPQTPFEPRTLFNYVLGFALGLIGGVGLAFFLESQDTSLYEVDDIEAVVALRAIAQIPRAKKEELDNYQNDTSKFANAFQNIVVNLQATQGERRSKVLLVVSVEENQGKSMVAHRLALTLADFGEKVIAVDCDTRTPKLHTLFELSNKSGLSDVLEENVGLKDALQESSFENVKLLAGGTKMSHPSKLLGLSQMADLLDDLQSEADYILLDSSALQVAFDIASVVPNVDRVLFIVRRGHAHREALDFMNKVLAGPRFQDKPIDLIIN